MLPLVLNGMPYLLGPDGKFYQESSGIVSGYIEVRPRFEKELPKEAGAIQATAPISPLQTYALEALHVGLAPLFKGRELFVVWGLTKTPTPDLGFYFPIQHSTGGAVHWKDPKIELWLERHQFGGTIHWHPGDAVTPSDHDRRTWERPEMSGIHYILPSPRTDGHHSVTLEGVEVSTTLSLCGRLQEAARPVRLGEPTVVGWVDKAWESLNLQGAKPLREIIESSEAPKPQTWESSPRYYDGQAQWNRSGRYYSRYESNLSVAVGEDAVEQALADLDAKTMGVGHLLLGDAGYDLSTPLGEFRFELLVLENGQRVLVTNMPEDRRRNSDVWEALRPHLSRFYNYPGGQANATGYNVSH